MTASSHSVMCSMIMMEVDYAVNIDMKFLPRDNIDKLMTSFKKTENKNSNTQSIIQNKQSPRPDYYCIVVFMIHVTNQMIYRPNFSPVSR